MNTSVGLFSASTGIVKNIKINNVNNMYLVNPFTKPSPKLVIFHIFL